MMVAILCVQQEFLINKAIESDYDHLTQFFIKYFHEGVVSPFIIALL